MRYLTTLCIVSTAMLYCSFANGQGDSQSKEAAATPCDGPNAAALQKQIEALIVDTQRLIKAKPPSKDFMIGWKTKDGIVTQILLIPKKPLPERTVKGFVGLKGEITRLPKGASVSYIFSDFRPDLLNHTQIIELSVLCKKNAVAFYLHEGG